MIGVTWEGRDDTEDCAHPDGGHLQDNPKAQCVYYVLHKGEGLASFSWGAL